MPPQMDYYYQHEPRASALGLTGEDALDPGAISCMLVGDPAVGKTSMVVSYTSNGYPAEYQQTGFDVFSGQVQVEGSPVKVQLLDTAGQEEFDEFRALSYSQTDVFLLCFSVVNPTSFHNVTKKWVPEIRAHNPTAPIVLVGTQSDLLLDVNVLINLDSSNVSPILNPRAKNMAEKIRATDYIECSSLTQKNLKEAFDAAIFAALKSKTRKGKKEKVFRQAYQGVFEVQLEEVFLLHLNFEKDMDTLFIQMFYSSSNFHANFEQSPNHDLNGNQRERRMCFSLATLQKYKHLN